MNAAFKALTDGGDKVDIIPGELEKGLPGQVHDTLNFKNVNQVICQAEMREVCPF